MKRLYDTSALLNLLSTGGSSSLSVLSGQAVLDLTVYELGNSIWKLSYLQKKINKSQGCTLLGIYLRIRSRLQTLVIHGKEEKIKELSVDSGQSFYDAAYLFVAKENNLELVTDDKGMEKAASKQGIKTSSS